MVNVGVLLPPGVRFCSHRSLSPIAVEVVNPHGQWQVLGLVCAPAVLNSNLSVTDGQQWEFMETRASRSGTGSLMVRYKRSL